MFKPTAQQFATTIRVRNRVIELADGVSRVTYADASPPLDFCNWRGNGGTSNIQSDTLVVSDTAEVTMWFRPDLSIQDCVLLNDDETQVYEIVNIENLEMRNMWMILKVVRSTLQIWQNCEIEPVVGYGRHAPEYGVPLPTLCKITRQTSSEDATGYFPSDSAIKNGDRVTCEGKTYVVLHVVEERLANAAHVEVSLRGLSNRLE